MPVDLARLTYNDRIIYRRGFTLQGGGEDQDEEHGPYSSLVVDIGQWTLAVRADGMHGSQPLYIVFTSDILSVESRSRS